jgi:hypothetical protein
MSQDNVEIVRRAYAAFHRHDFDTALEAVDPNIEWHQITQFPDRAVYRGREEMRQRFWSDEIAGDYPEMREQRAQGRPTCPPVTAGAQFAPGPAE